MFNTVAQDATGAPVDGWTTVQSGLVGYLRNPSPRPLRFNDAGTYIQARIPKIAMFYKRETTVPSIDADYERYRLIDQAGDIYRVIDCNEYAATVQLSVERVL
jgi:hypothetical protein